MAKPKILIVDDEPSIVELLQMSMRRNGYDSAFVLTGEEVVDAALREKPQLILLDLMLPGIDGIEACRRLRQEKQLAHIPIIMLTAKSEETDKVIGLGVGADDYVTKPFSVRELFARITAVLRRAEYYQPPQQDEALQVDDLEIYPEQFVAKQAGRDLELTRSEFLILLTLAQNQGKVVTREQLTAQIDGNASDSRSLDVHIRNLRRKLSPDEGKDYIRTMRGVGYKL